MIKLREKDGIAVYRTSEGVLKVFNCEEHRREIEFYNILQRCGVPTLQVLAQTENSLLLEDLDYSSQWRLGQAQDMDNPEIARAIAAWYKLLHKAGQEYPQLHTLPAETDVLALVNLHVLAERFPCEAFWQVLFSHYDVFRTKLAALPQTFTYNDFYYTNLAVARDGTAALMFDYNLAGRGYAYGDVRNVCWSLSPRAAEAFRLAYGAINLAEQAVDAVACNLVGLWTAAQREQFPAWAESMRESLENGTLLRNLEELL
ncbi:MAG: aminoglycoside phosphotransferase family protein [Oscillospiraceae bacterium]|nr:aminoglycoside phosphotransferase family protein [Oscillospiraceae bacterium]